MKKRIPLFLLLNLLWGVSTNGNAENSAYVSKVFDFVPAPGQFINQLPAHETNDDSAAIIKKVENYKNLSPKKISNANSNMSNASNITNSKVE